MATNPNRVPAGVPTGGRFAPSAHPRPTISLDAEPAPERPPTRLEVEAFQRRLAATGEPVRPCYLRDRGGHVPTVAEAAADRAGAEVNAEIARVRAGYERMRSAYGASDKSQDIGMVSCWNYGASYNGFERFNCPERGEGDGEPGERGLAVRGRLPSDDRDRGPWTGADEPPPGRPASPHSPPTWGHRSDSANPLPPPP